MQNILYEKRFAYRCPSLDTISHYIEKISDVKFETPPDTTLTPKYEEIQFTLSPVLRGVVSFSFLVNIYSCRQNNNKYRSCYFSTVKLMDKRFIKWHIINKRR